MHTYTHTHTHTHTHDECICVCVYVGCIYMCVYMYTYTHTRVAWLTHADAANRLSVYPSQGCMGHQALVQTSVLGTYEFAYACVFWHAYTCQTLVLGIVKQFAFKLSPSNSETRALGRMFRMHTHLQTFLETQKYSSQSTCCCACIQARSSCPDCVWAQLRHTRCCVRYESAISKRLVAHAQAHTYSRGGGMCMCTVCNRCSD